MSPRGNTVSLPNPHHVPHIANGVLLVAVGACAALLFGAPVEDFLSLTDNPVSRVVVVTFGLSVVGITSLSFAVHLLLSRHRQMERGLAEMRRLAEAEHARSTALMSTLDGLDTRLTTALTRLEEELADERERMRAQARAYLKSPVPGQANGVKR